MEYLVKLGTFGYTNGLLVKSETFGEAGDFGSKTRLLVENGTSDFNHLGTV